jgi:hypothetical protein
MFTSTAIVVAALGPLTRVSNLANLNDLYSLGIVWFGLNRFLLGNLINLATS